MKKTIIVLITLVAFMMSGCQKEMNNIKKEDVIKKESITRNEENIPAVDDLRATYLDTRTGVGFHMLNPQQLADDLQRADQLGLVFFNAPYEKDGKIPEIIRVGFELGYTKLPVPNMAGSAKDPEGLKMAYLKLIEDYQPVYVGLGNEIEIMQDKEEFIQIYNGIYDAIKNKCPDCIVYPVFQYEQFDPSLTEQMKLDLLVFTSYPFAKYSDIHAIPEDYYQPALQLAAKLDVQIAFTELGWTHLEEFRSGYSSTDEVQAAFIRRFKQLIVDSEVELAFASWGLLYGASQVGEEFAELGLYNQDSQAKQLLIDALLQP